MDVPALLDRLQAAGPALLQAAERAGWDARVPHLDWTVRELLTHTGGVHRWAAGIVRDCSATPDTEAGRAVGTGPDDDALADWFRAGHTALVETLQAAPGDLDCFSFLPADSARHFWARRQAHETTVHRLDADAAAGARSEPVPTDFALDGIEELLFGFAARPRRLEQAGAALLLRATDTGSCWCSRFTADGIVSERVPDPPPSDATVLGSADELYRWAWNRPSTAVVRGDPDVATRWAQTVRVRWS